MEAVPRAVHPQQVAAKAKLHFYFSCIPPQSLESLQVGTESSDRLYRRGAVEEAQATHLIHTAGAGVAECALRAQHASVG